MDNVEFKQLAIGQSFDFIGPNRMMNSFYLRCTKISARKYQDEKGNVHCVGSIRCKVHNVA